MNDKPFKFKIGDKVKIKVSNGIDKTNDHLILRGDISFVNDNKLNTTWDYGVEWEKDTNPEAVYGPLYFEEYLDFSEEHYASQTILFRLI